MRNVTITLDKDVARWARVRAAKLDTSVSRLLGEMLREMMEREEGYAVAMEQYLSKKPALISEPGADYPDRGDLHGRSDLR